MYSIRTQIRIGKWKRRLGQSPGESRCKLPGVPSQWSCMEMCLILPSKMCDNNTWSWVSIVFIGGQSCSHAVYTWLSSATQTPGHPHVHLAKTNIHHKSLSWDKFIQSNLHSMAQGLSLTKTLIKFGRTKLSARIHPAKDQFWRQAFLCRVWATQACWVNSFLPRCHIYKVQRPLNQYYLLMNLMWMLNTQFKIEVTFRIGGEC